jgi:hypothetical protein
MMKIKVRMTSFSLVEEASALTANDKVPASARNAYRIGRGTVLEGMIPGVLLPPGVTLHLFPSPEHSAFSCKRDLFRRAAARSRFTVAPMRFRVRGSFARCRACQGVDFYPAFPFPPGRRDVLICATCENETIHSELVEKTPAKGEDATAD